MQVATMMKHLPKILLSAGFLWINLHTPFVSLVAAQTQTTASGSFRGHGDVRKLHLTNRTAGELDFIYWIDGKYIPESINEYSYFFSKIAAEQVLVHARLLDELAALLNILELRAPLLVENVEVRARQTTALHISAPGRNPSQVCEVFSRLNMVEVEGFCSPRRGTEALPVVLQTPLQRYLITYWDGQMQPSADVLAVLESPSQQKSSGMSMNFVRHVEWSQWEDTFYRDHPEDRLHNLPCSHQLSGEIKQGDGPILSNAIREIASLVKHARDSGQHIGGIVLCLDSSGGTLLDGLQIAEAILDAAIPTRVESGTKCESSCFWIFMAGNVLDAANRTPARTLEPGGHLGFHAPDLIFSLSDPSSEEISAAFQLGARAVSEIVSTFSKFGAFKDGSQILKASLVTEMIGTPSSEMRFIETIQDVGRWNIILDLKPISLVRSREFVHACNRKLAWQRDQIEISFRLSHITRVKDNYIEIRRGTGNDGDVLCRFRVKDLVEIDSRPIEAKPVGVAPVFFFDPLISLSDLRN